MGSTQFVLTINKLTKFALAMSFLLNSAFSQAAESDIVDFKIATESASETVRVETNKIEAGEQNLANEGIVYITPKALEKSEVSLNKAELIPLDNGRETIGYFTNAKLIKHFKAHEELYMSTVGVVVTGLSIVVGQVIADGEVSLQKLLAVPLTMVFSAAYRYFYKDTLVFYNYRTRTPSEFFKARELYIREGGEAPGLKKASGLEQVVKMYLLSTGFMALGAIGSDISLIHFMITSIAFTFTTTYELIIAKKANDFIAQKKTPKEKEKVKMTANIASMGAGFADNVSMIGAMSGWMPATIFVWAAAIGLNTYHFGDKVVGYFRQPKLSCANLF